MILLESNYLKGEGVLKTMIPSGVNVRLPADGIRENEIKVKPV